jgi:hypothetical protein
MSANIIPFFRCQSRRTPELSRNNRAERGRDACNSTRSKFMIADNALPCTSKLEQYCKRHARTRHGCCRLQGVVRRPSTEVFYENHELPQECPLVSVKSCK